MLSESAFDNVSGVRKFVDDARVSHEVRVVDFLVVPRTGFSASLGAIAMAALFVEKRSREVSSSLTE